MELCKEFKALSCNEKRECISEGFDVDYQLTLPQYLDDIERVVKYSIKNILCDYELDGKSIKLFGKSIISLTYLNSSGCPHSNIFEEEFTRSIDIKSSDRFCFSNIRLNTRYSNFRLINQRKIDVHSSINAKLDVFIINSINALTECENAFLRRTEENILVNKYSSYTGLEFDEQFDILNKSTCIKNIVNTFVSCVVDDTKIIKDKMLVKLTAGLSIVYFSENDTYEKCQYTFTLSKIIDVSNCDDNDKAFINVALSELYIKAKADDNNSLTSFGVIGRLVIDYQILSQQKLEIVEDSYIPQYTSNQSSSLVHVNSNPIYYYDDKTVDCSFEFDNSIVEIIDLKTELSNVTIEESKLCFNATVCAIYYDDNSKINYLEKTERIALSLNDVSLNGDGCASLKGFDYSISNTNRINVRLNIEYQAFLYTEKKVSFVSDIDVDDEAVKEKAPELTLYFAKKNESVWNIAKSFSTDVNLIMSENNLCSDILDENRVLFVLGM